MNDHLIFLYAFGSVLLKSSQISFTKKRKRKKYKTDLQETKYAQQIMWRNANKTDYKEKRSAGGRKTTSAV